MLRKTLSRAPYVAAVFASAIFNVTWLETRPPKEATLGLLFSAVLIGFIAGWTRVERVADFLRKLPAMLASFLLTEGIWCTVAMRVDTSGGDQRGMVIFAIPIFAIYAVPFLLFGACAGWAFRDDLPNRPGNEPCQNR